MPEKCGICASVVNRQKPGVSCSGRCKNFYHMSCAKVPSDMLKFVNVLGFSWICTKCQNSVDADANFSDEDASDLNIDNSGVASFNTKLLSKIDAIFTEIKGVKRQQAELIKSVQFCSDKIDDFQKEMADIRASMNNIAIVESEVQCLKTENSRIKEELDNLQQYSRRSNLEIRGIPQKQNENVYEIIKSVASKLECDMNIRDIDACHRVRAHTSNSSQKDDKPIIVKFISRMKKDELLSAARKRKGYVTTADLGVDGDRKPVFINEHLTFNNKVLYKKSRDFCAVHAYKFCWVRDGKIYIRKSETSRVFQVSDDLLNKLASSGMDNAVSLSVNVI